MQRCSVLEPFDEKLIENLDVKLCEKLGEKLRESVMVFVAIWCDISYSGESLKGEACPSIILPNHQPGDNDYLRKVTGDTYNKGGM